MLDLDIEHRIGHFALQARVESDASITALFGRSGSGKSTLINIIAGLIRPDRGHVRVNGETLFDSERRIDVAPSRRRVGYVFQEGRLFPHLNVRQNLTYGRFFTRVTDRRIALEPVVEMLGLAPLLERRPGTLSGGEKQRVAIGRALLTSPRVLLMDEPLASLDNARKVEIQRYIETLRDQLKIPIVYVSHVIAEIVRLAETVVVLHEGRVVATGATSEVLDRPDAGAAIDASEIGAVIETRVVNYDRAYDISTLRFEGGELLATKVDAPIGTALRVYLRARDIALARERPVGTSILNTLSGTIDRIDELPQSPSVEVHLRIGEARLTARITRRSCDQLGLRVGQSVYALVKAVALDRSG